MFDEPRTATYHPLMQDPAFARALVLYGQQPVTLPCGLTLLKRRLWAMPLLMLPRAAPPENLRNQLRALDLHHHPLILSPERPCTLPRSLRLLPPRERIVWDVSTDLRARRAALHPKWRNQLTKAEQTRLTITSRTLPTTPNHPVLVKEQEQCRSRGYRNWPAPLTAAFAATAPEQTRLFQARCEGKTLAHMLFLTHGSGATYHIGHITTQGKRLGAHNLLLWEAACQLAVQGVQSIDLGLINPHTRGLNRFKLRTGAQSQSTGGTHLIWRPLG